MPPGKEIAGPCLPSSVHCGSNPRKTDVVFRTMAVCSCVLLCAVQSLVPASPVVVLALPLVPLEGWVGRECKGLAQNLQPPASFPS
jgi:hypothetical protein